MNNLISFLLTIMLIGTSCNAFAQTGKNGVNSSKKNVIIIYADDLGYGQVGWNGQKRIITPELDKFAANGIRFNNFYTSAPFCPPARNSLLTGLHTGESVWRVNDSAFGREPTIAQMFKQYGYDTSVWGKYGMGIPKGHPSDHVNCSNMDNLGDLPDEWERLGDPIDAGFDHFVGFMSHRDAHVYYHDSPENPSEGTPERPYYGDAIRQDLFQIKDGRIQRFKTRPDDYLPDLIIHKALLHINKMADQGKPFFMYLPSQLPHAELVTPPNYEMLYTDGKGNSNYPEKAWKGSDIFRRHVDDPRATLARMITRLDVHVKWIVDVLKERGLYENTIIFFSSDNGHHTAGGVGSYDYFDSNGGLRGHKWSLHEGGIRVPTIAFGGGLQSRDIDTRLAQYQIKDTLDQMLSGIHKAKSFWNVFRGGNAQQLDYLYFQFLHEPKLYPTDGSVQAVIKGDWKLVRYGKEGSYTRLYNLRNDQYENKSYNGERCDIVLELKQVMNQYALKDGLELLKDNCD
ncbi:sulfatase-like hydrolase/transferase [Salinivibrio proteolyticus]|uniref:Sulfatase-like hydrolase/transferase n=1 Tax=Salinivibrio proteolyticus TaxID=334715 RepID=A0ABY7LCA3_9GAMM|nr:sulfatase-like hydrolase/transferase [Salinivibrio proteolyticus]WBA13867.1 sulfatase-like hydrolase/transferase [Salinivibrio proteolyticus]